jgi:hypothetical protein
MTLKVYGNMRSSAFRVVSAAEELALDYWPVEIETEACSSNPTPTSLNPNKKIPVIDNDGTDLWETMAINLSVRESGHQCRLDHRLAGGGRSRSCGVAGSFDLADGMCWRSAARI